MKKILKRMAEINARRTEIRSLLEGDAEVNLEELKTELRELSDEYGKLEERKQALEGINTGEVPAVVLGAVSTRTEETFDQEKHYRSAWLKKLMGVALNENEQRAYSTAEGSGLPAIPESTANEIIKKMYEVAPILQRCKIFHVPGNFKFAVEGANADAQLHEENGVITPSADALRSVSLTGYEIVKLVQASRATANMTISAFEAYIVEIIAEAIARKIENYIFVGTGTTQPGGVAQGGRGENGAYTNGTDMVETTSVTENNVISVYGMLASGYERNAVWAMSKNTFFTDFYPLMNKSKNNLIEFANGKYYVMGCEVYFTGSLPAGTSYLGDYSYIIGNYSQDITVVKSEHSGLSTNSVHYLGSCVFDSKAISGMGAFVKLCKKASA